MRIKHWAVICPEPEAPGLWGTWLKERCVAVGWTPLRHHLEGPTDDLGWATARKRLKKLTPGDIVIPYLKGNRFGSPGRVVKVAVSDADWKPTVRKGDYKRHPGEAGLGRRIHVEWLNSKMPQHNTLAVVPPRMRHANGEVRQTIEPLNDRRYHRFLQIIEDRKNWKVYGTKGGLPDRTTTARSTPEKIEITLADSGAIPTAASALSKTSLYIQRARKAFPILVRQAFAKTKYRLF